MKRYLTYVFSAACLWFFSACGQSDRSAVGCYRGVDNQTGSIRTVTIRQDDGTNYVGSIGSYFVRGIWGVPMASSTAAWRLNKEETKVAYHFVAKVDGAVVNKVEGIAVANR